jgi:hypothetical protein
MYRYGVKRVPYIPVEKMSIHPTVLTTGNLIRGLVEEMSAGPMTEQRRDNCRALHRAMVAALNAAMDCWSNDELSENDKEILCTCARTLSDVRLLVEQGCSEMRRRFD